MLGGFSADESAAGLDAALGNPRHDLGDLLRVILSAGDVIQEEQRLGAAAHHVVDAHGHRVDTDGVVLVQEHGDFQLGANAVGAGNQHRLLHAGQIGSEQASEPADARHHPGDYRALDMLLHQFHRLVSRGDVHARGLIAVAVTFHPFSTPKFVDTWPAPYRTQLPFSIIAVFRPSPVQPATESSLQPIIKST